MTIRVVTLIIGSIILCWYGLLIYISPMPFDIIDRDNSGFISLNEANESLDLGYREIEIDGVNCIEYYWLKDALPAYINCEQS